jgi:hypothetical protein
MIYKLIPKREVREKQKQEENIDIRHIIKRRKLQTGRYSKMQTQEKN